MNFYIALIRVNEKEKVKEALARIKEEIRNQGEIFVVDTCEDTYDFLYNSFFEKAIKELKHPRG